ncbi:MAG: cytidylate kinase-like family protein [Lachnospiraceae bacterium]|nr:cytidylate kinase-like family protein [Lachnospiraceae bacterium]
MKHFAVTIARLCGSGATPIARLLCQKYDISLYDKKLLELAADKNGINKALFMQADEHTNKSLLYRISKRVYAGEMISPHSDDYTREDNLFNCQAKNLRELADNESLVCVGRAGDFILKDYPNTLNIFMYAPYETRVNNEMKRLGISQKEAEKHIDRTDKNRREYYRFHTGRDWENPAHYDMCIDTSAFSSYLKCAEIIEACIDKKFGEQ